MYHQMIGSLMYLTNTRPYILFSLNTLSQFLTDLRHVHLIAANHILRYLKGTADYGLKYKADQNINLEGYVDLDWAVPSIGRSLHNVASVWDQVWSLGLAGRNLVWQWVQLKHSMSYLVHLVVRKYGWGSYCLIYLISSWMLLVYIVTTRVVWSCQRTRCSMTSRSISRSSITISGIW